MGLQHVISQYNTFERPGHGATPSRARARLPPNPGDAAAQIAHQLDRRTGKDARNEANVETARNKKKYTFFLRLTSTGTQHQL